MQAKEPPGSGAGSQRAMQAVAAYLARYPDAADSEAGIFEWWLTEMNVEVSLQDLRIALAAAVAQGRLRLTPLADGTAIYRAADAR